MTSNAEYEPPLLEQHVAGTVDIEAPNLDSKLSSPDTVDELHPNGETMNLLDAGHTPLLIEQHVNENEDTEMPKLDSKLIDEPQANEEAALEDANVPVPIKVALFVWLFFAIVSNILIVLACLAGLSYTIVGFAFADINGGMFFLFAILALLGIAGVTFMTMEMCQKCSEYKYREVFAWTVPHFCLAVVVGVLLFPGLTIRSFLSTFLPPFLVDALLSDDI